MGFFFVIRTVGLLMMLTGTANPHSRRKLRECEISEVVVQFCSLNNIPNQYFLITAGKTAKNFVVLPAQNESSTLIFKVQS